MFYYIIQYVIDPRPLELETMKAIHIQWARYYLKVKNDALGI